MLLSKININFFLLPLIIIEKYNAFFVICVFLHHNSYRPYALTSCLHNDDAMLGSSCAHVLWQSALALSLSVSARARASPAVRHAGVGPLAACLAMAHVAVPRLTPNAAGRPSVTSYA